MTDKKNPLSIVVVGGSIGGLMAAIVLAEAGNNVTVLERTPEILFKDRGQGIGLRDLVVDFLRRYQPASVQLATFPAPKTLVFDHDGTELGYVPLPNLAGTTSWYSLVRVLHATFSAIVAGRPQPTDADSAAGFYRFGANLTDIQEHAETGKLDVTYETNGAVSKISSVDLVVGADGAHSTVRKLMGSDGDRSFSGYLLYRGMAQRDLISPDVAAIYDRTTLGSNVYPSSTIAYRSDPDTLFWAWYRTYKPAELEAIMTDIDGHRHAQAMPAGKMRPEVFESVKADIKTKMPPQIFELVEKGTQPGVQMVNDVMTPTNVFMNGRVLLVGEATCQVRPHTGAGTVQTTYHASRLGDMLDDKITVEKWGVDAMTFSSILSKWGKELGRILLMDPDKGNYEKYAVTRELMMEMHAELVLAMADATKEDKA